MVAFSAWPWGNFGNLKYLLYAPLAAQVVYSWAYEQDYSRALWCLHILIICGLKGLLHVLWSAYNNMLWVSRTLRINPNGVDFKQIDHEWHWDNYILLQAIIASIICYMSLPLMTMSTGNATLLESLILCVVAGVPLVGSCLLGVGSIGLIYGYAIMFDFLRCLGHCNVEIFSHKIFETLPILRYLIYTPTGTEESAGVCVLGSWGRCYVGSACTVCVQIVRFNAIHNEALLAAHVAIHVHGDVGHVGLVKDIPFQLLYAQEQSLPDLGRSQIWIPSINNQIENAILRADKIGVKVISLAALNKNEALNGGGTLFVNKHPDLRVRVVHGNTLTAAVILNEIPKDVKEVFLTGATSKLGRAIALYLCRRGVRVLMLTLSMERFQKIQKEASVEFQNCLVQVTKYNAAQNCKTWIVGKWLTPREQSWAPKGTHFHQFVVPPILNFRRNCTYGDLAAMRLPEDVQGLGTCEYTMDRGVVHACHAGGVVHMLEGWEHHEVGALDVDRIDLVWEAAMRHGLRSVSSLTR
ncbi:hypothetical protein Bca4012_011237 [Brassica carinata]